MVQSRSCALLWRFLSDLRHVDLLLGDLSDLYSPPHDVLLRWGGLWLLGQEHTHALGGPRGKDGLHRLLGHASLLPHPLHDFVANREDLAHLEPAVCLDVLAELLSVARSAQMLFKVAVRELALC